MVNSDYMPGDSSAFRAEEEAMLREMFDNNFLDSDEFVRFGPPRASRMFLKDELAVDSRPYNYPEDVEEKPELVQEKYERYKEQA